MSSSRSSESDTGHDPCHEPTHAWEAGAGSTPAGAARDALLCSAALRAHAAGKAKQSKAKGGGRDTPAGQQTKICYCYLGISKSYHAPRVEQNKAAACCVHCLACTCSLRHFLHSKSSGHVILPATEVCCCRCRCRVLDADHKRGWHVSFHPRQGVASPAATICQFNSPIHIVSSDPNRRATNPRSDHQAIPHPSRCTIGWTTNTLLHMLIQLNNNRC